MDNSNKHLFLITNNLVDYIMYLDLSDPLYIFHQSNFDRIPSLIKDITGSDARDILSIFVIYSEGDESEKIKKIRDIFAITLITIPPLFVFLKKYDRANDTVNNEIDTFYYNLPQANTDRVVYTGNFILYIEMLFQYMSNSEKVDDFIVNSFKLHVDTEIIKKQKHEIEELNLRLEALSKIDYLTNILNRRAFFEELEKERKRSLRFIWRTIKEKKYLDKNIDKRTLIQYEPTGTLYDHYGKFTCLLIDIDQFKNINDTWGHLIGDAVLQKIGDILKSKDIFRETDCAGRYGGEEFIILFPETSVANAKIAAERLREYLRKEAFHTQSGGNFHITVSMGMTEFRPTDKTNDQIIQRADLALYHAKNNGRDQIVIYEEVFPEKDKEGDT